MSERKYNYLGEDITGAHVQLSDNSYGEPAKNNTFIIHWSPETELCDDKGFDKTYRPIEGSDSHVIIDFVLPKGSKICRYGNPKGRFTAPVGSAYEALALPYIKETVEYHEYIVVDDIEVECLVVKGRVAPQPWSKGGAIQFMHHQSIQSECEQGFLKEDETWRLSTSKHWTK